MPFCRNGKKAYPQAGWGLIEFMLSSVLLWLVLIPVLAMIPNIQWRYAVDRETMDARDNARSALSVLSRLIRSAGNNPHRIGMTAIHIENAWTFSLESDLGGGKDDVPDGFLDDAFERVRIEWKKSTQEITLASGAGYRQPISRHITLLDILGLDEHGQPATIDDEIIYVKIRVQSEPAFSDPRSTWKPGRHWTIVVPILSRLRTGL